jgi:hypothetical protein
MQYEPGTHHIAKNSPPQPEETKGFRLNHLMLRIKVPLLLLSLLMVGSKSDHPVLPRCPWYEESIYI